MKCNNKHIRKEINEGKKWLGRLLSLYDDETKGDIRKIFI